MAALAAAMGIGWFAFTPLLPMMLSDGVITLVDGSWLATANYVGYLLGLWLAWRCLVAPKHASAGTRHAWPLGLAATVLLTLPIWRCPPWAWAALRFGAGVASAVVLLNIAAWCMLRPGGAGAAALGGLIFSGPGRALRSPACRPAPWWLALACCGGLGGVWPAVWGAVHWCGLWCGVCRRRLLQPALRSSQPPAGPAARGVLTLAYGLAGGLHRHRHVFAGDCACCLAGSVWPDLFWPLFGMAWPWGRPVHARAGGVGTGAGCCWWFICCRPLRLV